MFSLRSTALACLAVWAASASASQSRIINGVEVPDGWFPEVVQARAHSSSCSAALVGPRVLLTAAHCFRTGADITVQIDGRKYHGEALRNAEYPNEDLDVAVVILEDPVEDVQPVSLGGPVQIGQRVFLLGHGCIKAGGGGGNDGILRMGESTVTGTSNFDFVSRSPDGAALCFGDSGGPTYIKSGNEYRLVGINSKGNIRDTNFSADVNHPKAQAFLHDVAAEHELTICGLNETCGEVQAGAPRFRSSAFSYTVTPGTELLIRLAELLEAPAKDLTWFLDPAAPAWAELDEGVLRLKVPGDAGGTFTLTVVARNSDGAAAATLTLDTTEAPAQPPQCTLTATPAFIRLGQSLTLALSIQGGVTEAKIEGKPVDLKDGRITLVPAQSGVFQAVAVVTGPGGSGRCSTRYGVR